MIINHARKHENHINLKNNTTTVPMEESMITNRFQSQGYQSMNLE